MDFHNDWVKSMPYALIDPDRDPKLSDVNRTSELFASTTGLLLMVWKISTIEGK